MKFISSFLFVLCALTGLSARLHADEAKAASPWYKINEGEVYHSDFALKPGETKALKIDSAEPVTIGFRTDLGYAKAKAWNHPDLSAVKLSAADGEGLGASNGARRTFKPQKGTVTLTAKNNTDYSVKIVVYTKPSATAK